MNIMGKNAESKASGAREYLTFRLGAEEYGIDILKVQEIRGYEQPTRIANAPEFIKGVVNLRNRVVGIVVDSVSDVMELAPEAIRPAPDIESAIDNGCILGLGSVGERMLILLDIEKLMSNVDMGLVAPAE